MSDRAAEWTREQRNTRAASDEAARQNIERRQGITQTSGVQIDRKRTEYVPETQVGNMTISRGQQVTDREEMGAGAKDLNLADKLRLARGQNTYGKKVEDDRGLVDKLRTARGQNTYGKKVEDNRGLMDKLRTARGQNLMGKKGGGSKSPSLRDATSLAKKNPYVLAATTAGSAGLGMLKGEGGKVFEQGKAMIGRGCVKGLWSFLWPSFGHTIYPIAVLYLLSGNSRYARQYLPKMGDTWIPPEMLRYIPKPMRIPIKLGELLAIMFILFWVLMLDLACAGLLALIIGIIASAKDFVT